MQISQEQQLRGAKFLMVSAALVLVIAGLREIKPIALPLLIAVFLCVLSSPVFVWMLRHRIPKFLAVVVTVLLNLAVFAAMATLVGGSLSAFSNALPIYQQRAEAKAGSTLDWLEEKGVDISSFEWLQERARLEPRPPLMIPASPPSEEAKGEQGGFIQLESIVGVIGSTLWGVATLFATGLLVVLMMVFILAEAPSLPKRLEIALGWTPVAMERMKKAQTEVQRYLVYKTLISLATGLAVGCWVWALGVNFPLLWGVLAFAFNYIPSLGSIIAAVPVVFLAWIDHGTATAVLVGLGYLAVNVTLGNFLEPHLMGRRLGISTLVVFLSLVFWGWLWGPIGMLLSVPLTMILRIALENTQDLRWVAQLIAANAANTGPRRSSADSRGDQDLDANRLDTNRLDTNSAT